MALDGLGSDDIEVDGVMSQPSDPMPYERKCSWVFAPIAFSTRKSFWKKFLGNGVMSVTSVQALKTLTYFWPFHPFPLEASKSDARDPLLCEKQNPQKKPIGGLPL